MPVHSVIEVCTADPDDGDHSTLFAAVEGIVRIPAVCTDTLLYVRFLQPVHQKFKLVALTGLHGRCCMAMGVLRLSWGPKRQLSPGAWGFFIVYREVAGVLKPWGKS